MNQFIASPWRRAARPETSTRAPNRYFFSALIFLSSPWRRRPWPFFKMSRSSFTLLSSRRSRENSSRSLVVKASGVPPASSTSACFTHARTAVSVRSRRRATSEMLSLPALQRRTTSALNSGVNLRRCCLAVGREDDSVNPRSVRNAHELEKTHELDNENALRARERLRARQRHRPRARERSLRASPEATSASRLRGPRRC